MNALFLVAIALVCFVLGYRYYGKLLALTCFRLDTNYSISGSEPSARVAATEHGHKHPVVLTQHLAILVTASSIAGSVIALIWGWIPAFLWLVSASTVAAAVYGMGSLWLSRQHPGKSLSQIATRLIGPLSHNLYFLIITLVLLMICTTVVDLAVQLLARYPSAVIAFVLQLALGEALVYSWRKPLPILPTSLVALLCSLLAIGLLDTVPVAFSGGFNLDLGDAAMLTVTPNRAWLILLLTLLYYTTSNTRKDWRQARAHLSAMHAATLLIVFFLGLAVVHPELKASDFHNANQTRGVFPWLFVIMSGGAIAGFHLLIAHGISAPQMLPGNKQLRRLGYGGAMVDGVFALTALLLAATAFSNAEQWHAFYQDWTQLENLGAVFLLYVDAFAAIASALGIGETLARNLAVVTLLSLFLTTLEACIVVLRQTLQAQGQHHALGSVTRVLQRPRGTVLLLVLIGLLVLATHKSFDAWLLLGLGSLLLTCLGFTLILLELRRQQRSIGYVALPLVLLAGISLGAGLALLHRGFSLAHPWLFAGAATILIIGIGVLMEIVLTRQKPGSAQAGT